MAERPASPLASMAGRPSLEDLLQDVPPEKLDQPCRDEHLSKIALSITDWQSIAPFLGLTEADEVIIRHDYPNWITQKIGMLRTWKKRFGGKATYRKLGKVFFKLERADLVEELCELLQTESSGSSSDGEDDLSAAKRIQESAKRSLSSYAKPFRRGRATMQSRSDEVVESFEPTITVDSTSSHATQANKTIVRNYGESETQKMGTFQKFWKKLLGKNKSSLDSYAEYLRGRYSTEVPAFFTLQWPPPPTRKVFNLAMIGHRTIQRGPIDEEFVRLTLRGNVDDIMRMKVPIELKNLFKLEHKEHKVILIEGAPGAGKSTLAWYVCQKWESGGLFQKFKVVIFVQLRDPAIQSATSIADILPVESQNMRGEVMSELLSCRGRGVLFVLDGWDEYGPGLWAHSLFQQLICTPGEVNMHFSSLIITSRPIASGELQQYASSRVEIVGFSSAEVKKYFSECMGMSETVQKLQDHLRERPVIEASCYLPLNAAIVVHLFLALNHTLPHTLHEVFLSLVLCCIIRHLTKEAEEGEMVPSISSLDDLPPDVQKPFNNICTMAYQGVMKNKVTFSATDLRSFNLPTELSTLSLIQAVQSFTAFEKSISYNFLHLSVQELLAAVHISKLPAAEQIQIFNDLFDQPRLVAVFQFYAAFTKLQTKGVRDIVARIIQKQQKPLLVNLLHGLYEAQDLSLCEFVASHLKRGLDLSGNTLSPMDCLVVGYFLSCVCLTTSGEFKVNLRNCSLDDYRVSFLVRELSKRTSSSDAQTTTRDGVPGCLAMDLRNHNIYGRGVDSLLHVLNVVSSMYISDQVQNDSLKSLKRLSAGNCGISQEGGKAIGDALMVNRYVHMLDLHNNPISAGVVHIAESLKHNHSLLEINLGKCSISEKGCMAIGDALMVNRSLHVLDLHDNQISAGVVRIAESLKHNHSLLEINLGKCGITEKGCKAIGDALMVNRSLQVLDLHNNPISAGVVHIAESLKRNHSLLVVNLGSCGNLADIGAAHIADGLRHNNCLKKLDITDCGLCDRCTKSLASALEVNISLEWLDLSENSAVTAVGLMALGESLKRNRGLQTLRLYGWLPNISLWNSYHISDNDWKQFIVCLQENNHLTELWLLSFAEKVVRQEMTTLNSIRRKNNLPPLNIL